MARRRRSRPNSPTFADEDLLGLPAFARNRNAEYGNESIEIEEGLDEDDELQEDEITYMSADERALNGFVQRFPPGICQDLAYYFYCAKRNGHNFDPVTMAQAWSSGTLDPPQVLTSRDGSGINQAGRSQVQDLSSVGSSENLSFFGLGHQRGNSTILTPTTPDNIAEAAIREAIATEQLSFPQQYRASLSQLVSQTRSYTRTSRSSPPRPNWHRYANLSRSYYNSLEGMYRAMALPSQPTTEVAVTSSRPSTPMGEQRSERFLGFPISRRRRQRPLSQLVPENSERDHSDETLLFEGAIIDHMEAEATGWRHRKRRRAYSPVDSPSPSNVQSAIRVRADEQTVGPMNLNKTTGRSASTGGASRTPILFHQPTSNIPSLPATHHVDLAGMQSSTHHYGTSDRATPRLNPLLMQHQQTSLPPWIKIGSKELIFISEIVPRSFDSEKRSLLHHIFRRKAAHIPAAVSAPVGPRCGMVYYVTKPRLSFQSKVTDLPLGPGRRGWPAGRLPVEVFDIVTSYLPRDSVSAMRLVNGEFEMKTSNRLFHTVVVPFRSEIYGLMTHKSENEESAEGLQRRKGKGKARAKVQAEIDEVPEENRIVHDGMKVFEAWGPHIKRFAMAFEVEESSLEKAPLKGKFEHHTTWWGGYEWPHPYYNRYEFCEGLEKKADEFKCMSKAMSFLNGTRELGLSLDSGLGWLVGPDMSDRAKLFQDKSKVFGRRHSQPDLKKMEREETWNSLSSSITSTRIFPSVYPSQGGFCEAHVLIQGTSRQITFPGVNDQPSHRPLIFEGIDVSTISSDLDPSDVSRYATDGVGAPVKPNTGHFGNARLKPKDLTNAQQEWLLETEWAQRAFLSSFCMALADNSKTFQHVHTLNISKLSSRYLSALQRDDVWKALPNMTSLTINVSPDWRTINKTDTGVVESPAIVPSKAATQFFALLKSYIAKRANIKSLSIGYIGGGEHQVGIFGRNKAVLPAPLMDVTDPAAISLPLTDILTLSGVEQLTISNCWTTPDLLKHFISQMSNAQLRQLSLNSVSLTSDTTDTRTETIVISPGEGTYDQPQDQPRRHSPSVGNFFSLRRWHTPDPEPSGWATQGQRIGSWGNVIDAITPGPTMDFIRYAYAYHDDPPPPRPTKLERITFSSCGYVNLPQLTEFNQDDVGEPIDLLPACLLKRTVDLVSVMMTSSNDQLTAQIVPAIKNEEKEALETAFQMRMGWEDGADRAWENLEDGQPLGGSGRFSGEIDKLILPIVDG